MSKLTGWRRIASAMWGPPADPQVYGAMEIDATRALEFMSGERALAHHVTPTHLVGRAVAHAIAAVPDLNVRILGTHAIARPSIDIFFITSVHGGHDLSGAKIERVDELSASELASALDARKGELKSGRDREFARTKRVMDALPRPLLRAALGASEFLTGKLALDMPALGLHHTPFGSAMITSVGMLGLPQGFAPLAWVYDVPLLVLLGEIVERPLVVAHQVVVRPVLPITATIDHRYVDGFHVAKAMFAFREYLSDPGRFEPARSS